MYILKNGTDLLAKTHEEITYIDGSWYSSLGGWCDPEKAYTLEITPDIPQSIKKWRGQVVLHRRDLLEQVEAIIVQSPEMNIIYKNVTDFERDNTLIAAIASVMGWDDAYIDEFFIEASKVVAG